MVLKKKYYFCRINQAKNLFGVSLLKISTLNKVSTLTK